MGGNFFFRLPHNVLLLRGIVTSLSFLRDERKNKMITDIHRLKAIEIFLEEPNTVTLSKDELILGLRSILGIEKGIDTQVDSLYMEALEKVYKGRK